MSINCFILVIYKVFFYLQICIVVNVSILLAFSFNMQTWPNQRSTLKKNGYWHIHWTFSQKGIYSGGSLDKHVLHKGKQMVLRTIHCKVLWETKNGFPTKLLFGSFLFKSVSLCQYVGWWL